MREAKKMHLGIVFQGLQVAYNLKGLFDIGKKEGRKDETLTDQ